jgi:hypothetical protein
MNTKQLWRAWIGSELLGFCIPYLMTFQTFSSQALVCAGVDELGAVENCRAPLLCQRDVGAT